tara:strand:+ start:3315 stop:3515 length:201 start_codon:yes stop_codon:yes gene_type:complete
VKKRKKQTREMNQILRKAFDSLDKGVREQIKVLEKAKSKRRLTKEEEEVMRGLRKEVRDAKKSAKK